MPMVTTPKTAVPTSWSPRGSGPPRGSDDSDERETRERVPQSRRPEWVQLGHEQLHPHGVDSREQGQRGEEGYGRPVGARLTLWPRAHGQPRRKLWNAAASTHEQSSRVRG